jgi:hypothetical protein
VPKGFRSGGGDDEAAPHDLPRTTPEGYASERHDFTLQAVMEMQRSIGQMSAKIERLIEDTRTNRESNTAEITRLANRLDQSIASLEQGLRKLTHW